MRAKDVKRRDKETRALLVLDVVKKGLKHSAVEHEKLKAQTDLMISVTEDVLRA